MTQLENAFAGTDGLAVLVVEDSPDVAATMAMLLRCYGHRVDTAADGIEGLEKILRDRPDAVILDIGLPGMTGYEVARAVTAQRADKTPLLIAVSGYASDEDRQRSKEAGIHFHLAKPANPFELESLLARFGRATTPR